ncbi:MAG: type II secretion system F family protein [Sedimentisphaerales bacterium]|nr:type II secretion system F family protein [Sedimentisphaerales bacterium]
MIVGYQAIDSSGKVVNDTLVVDDLGQANAELNSSGMVPVRIWEQKESHSRLAGKWSNTLKKTKQGDVKRASRRDLPFFTEQMSILLETGTPVAASLKSIEKQVICPHWRLLVQHLHRQVEEGGSLASAVAAYPQVFDPIFCSMISAGEASGKLPAILNRLAMMSRQSDRIRNKIISAMIYPALLTSIALSVICVLIFIVLPRFAAIFKEMNVNLPASTRILLVISELIRQYLFLTLALVASVVVGLIWWLRSNAGVKFMAKFTLRLPIFGSLIRSVRNARLFRIIGLLIESKVSLVEALQLTSSASKNYLYVDMVNKMEQNVLNGRSMHEIMSKNWLIPASIAQMVHTGEENAQVGRVMTMLADHLDDRNETQINTLTSIMEPIILIFMGVIIGIVAISLVLPMFDLSKITG